MRVKAELYYGAEKTTLNSRIIASLVAASSQILHFYLIVS